MGLGWTALTAQERHCPLLRAGESGHIQEEGNSLVCAYTRFNYCSLAANGCQAEQQLGQKYNLGQKCGARFCARLSVEDTVVPAAFLEGFPVVVNAALVRTAPQLEQRM